MILTEEAKEKIKKYIDEYQEYSEEYFDDLWKNVEIDLSLDDRNQLLFALNLFSFLFPSSKGLGAKINFFNTATYKVPMFNGTVIEYNMKIQNYENL